MFYNLYHEPLGKRNNSKIRETGKYLPILHEATCNNYVIVKCLMKLNVHRVILLTNCIELV